VSTEAITARLPQVLSRRSWRPGKFASRTLFYVLVAIFILVSLFPFYWMVITSLKSGNELSSGTTGLFLHHPTFSAYTSIFSKYNFIQPLINSAIVCLGVTVLSVFIGALAGYGLARTRMRFKGSILGFILIVSFFPILAMVGPMVIAYKNVGLLNTLPGLIIAYFIYTLPIATWLLTNFFSQIPAALEEAAIVDGATRLQALRKVIVPVALPGVFTATIMSFILAWNDFAFALSFITSDSRATAPLAIVNIGHSQYHVFYNLIDAAVVIVTIPVALLVIFAQKRIISGLTAGALK